MKLAATVLGGLAAAFLIAGLVVGFGLTLTSDTGVKCGSAFKEDPDLAVNELSDTMMGGDGRSGCDGARSSAKPLPVVLLVMGGAAALGAFGVVMVAGPSLLSDSRTS